MKKHLLIFMAVLLVFTSIDFTTNNYLQAADDKSYYGDGVSAKWDDISPYLSVLYRNTPYISISNGKTVNTFFFNIELFWDLGLYVYGDPNSVQFTGTVNDFKAAANGYFRTGESTKPTLGEYRYLGYSISGVPITNSRFPTEMQSDGSTITLIKYSELPENLKSSYGVNNYSNVSYMEIRDLIENPLSPAWDFTTVINNEEVTLRERLSHLGLFKNNVPSVSLLDYGIVYSWAESGGVIRLFFRFGKYGEKYSYATFTGPVSVDFSMKFPCLEASMNVKGKEENTTGKNTFYINASDGSLSFDIMLHGIMKDSLGDLSVFAKKYTYTREQMTGYSIVIDNKNVSDIAVNYMNSSVIFDGVLRGYKIYEYQLLPGRNTFRIPGLIRICFNKDNSNHYISASCYVKLTIFYDKSADVTASNDPLITPKPTFAPDALPSATSTPSATHSAKPSTSPTATANNTEAETLEPLPVPTPYFVISRKW